MTARPAQVPDGMQNFDVVQPESVEHVATFSSSFHPTWTRRL
jgi:hypothetical protein